MKEDILNRLDNFEGYIWQNQQTILNDAHEEIEKLREALRPFAEKYLWPDDSGYADEIRSDEDWNEKANDNEFDDIFIQRGWIRAAREALQEKKDG